MTAESGSGAGIGFIIREMVAIVGAAPVLRPNPRILLVKTSSLGDVVHNLPVVTDLRRQFQAAHIDWLVEEGFADIPRLHPAVNAVIPVAVRRWRKQLLNPATWREIGQLRQTLQVGHYDLVIDTQGLLKSAVLARWAGGQLHGYSTKCVREPLAARFYAVRHDVPIDLHAVERNRRLVAASCGYALANGVDYGVAAPAISVPLPFSAPYVVLLTATSRSDKLWPEAHWISLGRTLATLGLRAVLPAGSTEERARAARIAVAIDGYAPPALGIAGLARLLADARGVIGVDTGLTHLGAALGRPTIALFCASSPGLTGVLASQPVANLGSPGHAPMPMDVLQHCQRWTAST